MISILFFIQSLMLIYIIASGVYFAFKRGQSRCIRAFSIMCLGACLWGGGQFWLTCINMWFSGEHLYLWVNTLTFIGICVITPASIVFSWVYTGRYQLYESKTAVLLAYAPSFVLLVIHVSNPLHGLYYSSIDSAGRVYGPAAFLCAAWSYASVLYVCAALARYHKNLHPEYVKYFLLCGLIPLVTNTLNMVVRNDRFDLTISGLFFLMTGAGILTFKHKLVNVSVLAFRKVLKEIGYPIYILSPEGDVLFENDAALLAGELMALYEKADGDTVTQENGMVYRPTVTTLPDMNTLLAFNDITLYAKALSELNHKNAELMELRDQLKKQMKATEQYAAFSEADAAQRSRAAIMGKLNSHIYVIINRILENTEQALSGDKPEIEAIMENIKLTSEGITMVRAIINEYKEVRRHGF